MPPAGFQVESAADIHWLFSEVKAVGRTRIQREKEEPMAFISMCESARGLLNLRCVPTSTLLHSDVHPPHRCAVMVIIVKVAL